MAILDLEKLLQPVSADDPCGESLEYDDAFTALETDMQGKPEQQFGKTIIPAEEPDWRDIQKRTLGLLERSKDLRLVLYLTRALLNNYSFAGLNEGLALMKALLQTYWETIHPHLDPEEDNDPTLRANILAALCDRDTLLRKIRELPLVSSRTLGRFNLRDIELATGVQTLPKGSQEQLPKMTDIDAAFLECEVSELQINAQAVRESLDHIAIIDAYFTDQVGAAQAPDLSELVKTLKEIQHVLSDRLNRRGIHEPVASAAEEENMENIMSEETIVNASETPSMAPVRVGEINSREDVIRLLDKLCDYYAKNEPSSPVPLLLHRARRLASKNFIDILRDIAPDAVAQVEVIRGPDGE